MNTTRTCPGCGKPLAADAPQGVCPECLMRAGLGTETGDADPSGRAKFTPPTLEDLAVLFPQFEIISFIGQGGMGAVYKARQKQLDRIAALKILPPSTGHEPAFAERFAREARAMAKLNHPGIVTIYDFGQARSEAGASPIQLYYFIMEFVDGVSLRQLFQAGRVAPREALAIVPQICDALQYAHDHGIVHRDIKPENILLDRQGRVKVADFGLAKLVGSAEVSDGTASLHLEGLTDAGKIMGTPDYMAPEQAEHPADVDHRVDVYALGVVFYQMLTGELPAKRIEPPSRKVRIDVRLDEIVLRALERLPERRYQTARELRNVVETVATQSFGSASAPAEPGVDEQQSHPEPPEIEPEISAVTHERGFSTGPRKIPLPLPQNRWSRTAIAGAALLGFFLAVMVSWFFDWPSSRDPAFGDNIPQMLFHRVVIPISLAAFLASTVLGWTAVKKIRRAAGRIRGLGLALFDGLFLPIVVTDLIILFAWSVAIRALAAHRGLGGSMFRDLWEFAFFSVLLGFTAAVANYLIISPLWRVATRDLATDVLGSVVSTRRKLLLLSTLSGLAVSFLVPASVLLDETSRKARYGWQVERGTELRYEVFEASADIVNRAVPFDVREPGNAIASTGVYMPAQAYTSSAQMAEIQEALLTALRDQAVTNSGLFVNKTNKGQDFYQWRSDSWSYNTGEVRGKGDGFCGMGRDTHSNRLRIRYRLTHVFDSNSRFPVSAEISYEGPTPEPGKARVFFIPFGREQHSEYLVIAFTFEQSSKDSAGEGSMQSSDH